MSQKFELNEADLTTLRTGSLIERIRVFRTATGWGLKMAHDACQAIMSGRMKLEEFFTPKNPCAACQGMGLVAEKSISPVEGAQGQADKEALIEQRDKAYREVDAMKLQIDELKLAVKESNADADALILLSKGLYERIQGKPDWVVASSCQTALNYIDYMNRLVGEIRKILVGAVSDTAKVIRIEGVLTQSENRKCGIAKPLGDGERCIREIGHSEPCDHRK